MIPPSLPAQSGWDAYLVEAIKVCSHIKKEGRLTTTIFTNLKSYTMKNTMQR